MLSSRSSVISVPLCLELPIWSDDIIDFYESSCSQLNSLLFQKYSQWLVQLRAETLSLGPVRARRRWGAGGNETRRAAYPAGWALRCCEKILSRWNNSIDQLFLFMVFSFMGFSFCKIIRSFSRSAYKKPTGSVFLKECDWGLFFLFCYICLALKTPPPHFLIFISSLLFILLIFKMHFV